MIKLVLVSVVLASIEARPEADPYYLTSYGSLASFASPLTFPYTFQLGRNRIYPARLVAPVPQPQDVPAAPTLLAKAVPAVPGEAIQSATINSQVSSQYHAQDEDKNFAFGYTNINSARQEAGNAYTGVTGSYTDGTNTVNYVADAYGFRHV